MPPGDLVTSFFSSIGAVLAVALFIAAAVLLAISLGVGSILGYVFDFDQTEATVVALLGAIFLIFGQSLTVVALGIAVIGAAIAGRVG